MKKPAFLLLMLVLAFCVPTFADDAAEVAGENTVSIPVKGVLTGPSELVFTVYARPNGGRELFSVTRNVTPGEHGIYVENLDVPLSAMGARDRVFVEVAAADNPALPIGTRQQFTQRRSQEVTLGLCSLCFTCGGAYPVLQGAFNNTGSAPSERGSSCSGNVTSRSDTRPFLCCQ